MDTEKRMRAVVWTGYGPPEVLQLRDVEIPLPGDKEVRIKVHAATVTAGDCDIRGLKMPLLAGLAFRLYLGLRKPTRITIIGQELAGEVEAVGRSVTRFKQGDRVFAGTFLRFGAYGEYACLPEKYVIIKPDGISYEESATIPVGGLNGFHLIRVANVQAGDKVLIVGAGGSIGSYAVQIAKSVGAEVTGVDSAEKLAMLSSIGADHVIDYRREDFTKSGKTYDVIIDLAGKNSFSGTMRSLEPEGRYVFDLMSLSASMRRLRGRRISRTTTKKVISEQPGYRAEEYERIIELIVSGKVKPVIDRRYPLGQTAEAHRYVDGGHKKGNVVITVAE